MLVELFAFFEVQLHSAQSFLQLEHIIRRISEGKDLIDFRMYLDFLTPSRELQRR